MKKVKLCHWKFTPAESKTLTEWEKYADSFWVAWDTWCLTPAPLVLRIVTSPMHRPCGSGAAELHELACKCLPPCSMRVLADDEQVCWAVHASRPRRVSGSSQPPLLRCEAERLQQLRDAPDNGPSSDSSSPDFRVTQYCCGGRPGPMEDVIA